MIGFQTQADVDRFGRLVLPGISAPGEGATGRGWGIPRLVAGAASIDTARFKALATDARIRARAAALRADTGGRRIVLRVDRLDYTKAIPSRLDAYEWLLDVGLVDPGDVAFIQVAVPSRAEISAYRAERAQVEQTARRINRRFDPTGADRQRQALWLQTEALDATELVAWPLTCW